MRYRFAYSAVLLKLFIKAARTNDARKGPVKPTAVVHAVVAETLRLSMQDAEELVNGHRETTRAAKDAEKKNGIPKTSPVVKVCSNRRTTFYAHLCDIYCQGLEGAGQVSYRRGKDSRQCRRLVEYGQLRDVGKGAGGHRRGHPHHVSFPGAQGDLHHGSTNVGKVGHVHALLGLVLLVSDKKRLQ